LAARSADAFCELAGERRQGGKSIVRSYGGKLKQDA